MSLPNYLSKIKSSGIYRFVFDKSEVPGEQAETMRLLVGYSEKGPFNTLVYVSSQSEFKTIFGGINKKLERRGCFFHRMAMQALTTGPILAINLKPFKNNETVKAASFNVMDTITPVDLGIEDIYDTTRFWFLQPEGLGQRFAEKHGSEKYITISAADSKETTNTVFMRGYKPTGYDISFKEWYSAVLNGEDLPSYLEGHEMDKVEEYFAEVFVFRGKFTKDIATSEALAKYFDVEGDNVTLKPYILNAFNEKKDTLSELARDPNSNFITSYSGCLLPNFSTSSGSYISLDLMFNAGNDEHKMLMNLNIDALYDGTVTVDKLNTTGWQQVGEALEDDSIDNITIDSMSCKGIKPVYVPSYYDTEKKEWTYAAPSVDTFADPDLFIYSIGENATVSDYTISSSDLDLGSIAEVGDKFIVDTEDSTDSNVVVLVKKEVTESGTGEEATKTYTLTFDKKIGGLFDFSISGSGDFSDDFSSDFSGGTTEPIASLFKCNHNITESCQGMVPTAFDGYDYGLALPDSKMINKLNWQNTILGALTDYEGIRLALTNHTDSEYHYLVDTFESYVDAECKATLGVIAKEKDNCLALVNFPSIESFKKCDYASFTDKNGKFQTKFIKDGYNHQKPASKSFSVMSEFNGASFVSYDTPVVLTDGTVKTICPSAALVSNAFMAKYDTRLPYSIVAGPSYGRINYTGLVGPDFNFSRADLDILEPLGVNCLVYVPNKGTYINSNQTAKQNPVTALSKINVRELVIFLQDEIEKLLQAYQWEYNTAELRATIKSKADTICEQIKANGGLYEYLNVCDDSNNTPEVIDNEMIVLDTSIEPGRGAGKMVQTLTIYRTGGMKSMIK